MDFRAAFHRCLSLFKSQLFLVSVIWILGLVVGICFANVYDYNPVSAEKLAVVSAFSPVSLFFIAVLPVALISLSLLYAPKICPCMVVAVEAVCRGYSSMLVVITFGNAAWLIRSLFLFSSILTSVLMWWLIFRYRYVNRYRFRKDIFISLFSAVIIAAVDIIIVAPFLRDLTLYI